MIIPALILLLALTPSTRQNFHSPCPDVLEYGELSPDEPAGRALWHAKIHLPRGGHWLFMSIVLDRRANLLGNWYGDTTTQDNMEYKIDNPDFWTKREPISFFVQYDTEETPPRVQLISLDGREICFDNGVNETIIETPVLAPVVESHTTRSAPSSDRETPVLAPVVESHTTRSAPSSDRTISTESFDIRLPMPVSLSNTKQECGKVLYKYHNPLVVNGVPTQEGQWPWQVALYKSEQVDNNYVCGGTLVSHRHVITAAHCTTIRDRRPFKKLLHYLFTVYLGKHNLKTSVEGVQIRFVSKITVHPDYGSDNLFSRDLSILELETPVQYTDWVQPACLWPDDLIDLNHVIGRKGSVVGWGNDKSGELLLVEMPVVSQEACLRSEGSLFYLTVTSNYTYCAGLKNGQSACNGDSGGGMVFNNNGFWYLRGVVSLAPYKPNENVCDPMLYVVFTDLAKFMPWIRENIEPY